MTKKAKSKAKKIESKKTPPATPAKQPRAGGRRARPAEAESARAPAASAPIPPAAPSAVPSANDGTSAPAPATSSAASSAPETTAGEVAPEGSAPAAAPTGASSVTARDPRLPAPGTVLQKKDRKGAVRCECVVADDGFVYQGTVYRSLSAAAVTAGKDLGLTGAQNGFAFWGLAKPTGSRGPRKGRDPVKSLDKAYAQYRKRLNSLLSDDTPEDARARLLAAVKDQGEALLRLGPHCRWAL